MNKIIWTLIIVQLLFSCQKNKEKRISKLDNRTSLIILGTVQDAGSPHIACEKDCCKTLFQKPDKDRKVVSLGICDSENQKTYIFEASPDFPSQMKKIKTYSLFSNKETPDGIFLTHAHIGHYSGLMYLGKEAMSAKKIPVFAMPRMQHFLKENGPWSQLVNNKNIVLKPLIEGQEIELTSNIRVIPFIVPHRDEYSETVGYKIIGPNKTILFIPDIDKWSKWGMDISEIISDIDYAFLDATFYDEDEINNRDISEIPHPFVIESMELFKNLKLEEKRKIHFIHFNHTNPLLNKNSTQYKEVINNGYNISSINEVFEL